VRRPGIRLGAGFAVDQRPDGPSDVEVENILREIEGLIDSLESLKRKVQGLKKVDTK
jgi:hypothetical protein